MKIQKTSAKSTHLMGFTYSWAEIRKIGIIGSLVNMEENKLMPPEEIEIKGRTVKVKQLIILGLLIAGLSVALILVKNPQIFKSQADVDVNVIIAPTDTEGNELEYQGNNTYKTNSNTINIELR